MPRPHIPWAEPKYWGNEERYVLEALRSTWISGGPFVERLEAQLAKYCSSPHVVLTSNGTTALHCAFLALGLQPGDEIVVPGFAFMAAANVAIHMGAIPVFADVDPNTWCVTAESLSVCISSRTRGLVPVHTYGNVCDMRSILRLAQERSLWVVEDAAEALGSTYRGQQAGTIADVGIFSFHATKTITTGEGGAVATKSLDHCHRMQLYRSHGVQSRRYWHEVAGHNFRLTNMQAAIGCAQMEQIEPILRERERLYRRYRTVLEPIPGLSLQAITPDVEPVVWAVALHLHPQAFPQGRDEVMAALASKGIETRPGFWSATDMPHLYRASNIPAATVLGREVLSLPSSPNVSDAEIAVIGGHLAALTLTR